MPKTTKRDATKRAEKIAKAYATPLPPLEVKEPKQQRGAGYKRPARGLARYPWAVALSLLVIASSVFALSYFHVGPFAQPKPPVKHAQATPTAAIPTFTPTPGPASPCLKVVNQLTDTSPAPTTAGILNIVHIYKQAPPMTINTNKIYCAGINTNRGLIVLQLDPKLAPVTVNNFVFLAQHHFYDGLVFHRVIQTGTGLHIIQTGDPQGNGTGGPGYKFKDEAVKGAYNVGCVAMANSGPNTNGSQFFICTGNDTQLPKSYNLFGQVVEGLDVSLRIQGPGDDTATKNIQPDQILHVTVVPVS